MCGMKNLILKNSEFLKLKKYLTEKDCEYLYRDKNKKVFIDNMTNHAREFEEGRFFPLTKGMNLNLKDIMK